MAEALEVMQRWFGKPDPALFHDDIDWYVPGYPVPRERYVGRAAVVLEFMPALRAQFPGWTIVVRELVEAGDRVTAVGHYDAVTADGRAFTIRFLHLWTVRDGKIAAVIAAADTAQFVRALG